MHRRQFIESAAAVAAATALPGVAQAQRKLSANDKLNIALFGVWGRAFAFNSSLNPTGHQFRPSISPAGVPRPTRVSSSFSSFDNMISSSKTSPRVQRSNVQRVRSRFSSVRALNL